MYVETVASAEGAIVLPLEADLQATRDRLQSTTEQLESSNEQLRSGNEELSSINEELQSANEEWEASREELRSTNEVLQTVNSELKTRVDELSCANSDLVNLLECTQIAMFVADRDFALKSFTTAAKDHSILSKPTWAVRFRIYVRAFASITSRTAPNVSWTLSSPWSSMSRAPTMPRAISCGSCPTARSRM
jgi:two-component system CheB/CheR fusion protein